MRVRPWAEVCTKAKDWADTVRWVSTHDAMIRRLVRSSQWRRILQGTSAALETRSYADPKVACFAGVVVPWPTQLLVVATR